MKKRVAWLFPGSLENSLDNSTWLEVGKGLKALGWDISYISSDTNKNWLKMQRRNGLGFFPISFSSIYFLGKLVFHLKVDLYLIRHISSFEIIFYTQESAIFLVPILSLKKIFSWKFPIFILDSRSMPMDFQTKRHRLRGKYYLWVNKHGRKLSDYQTVITERLCKALALPEDKIISVWPSGVRVEEFKPASLYRKWSTNTEPMKLVYIGALTVERKIVELCEAVINLRKKGYILTLKIAGNGYLQNEILYRSQNPDTGINYLGNQTHQQIPFILAEAEVGVLPFPDEIQFRVSSPIKLFEYLASGLIIIATQVACNTDILGESDAFWAKSSNIPDLEQAIINAYNERDKFPQMSARSYNIAKKCTWSASAKKLSDGFEKVLKNE